MGTCVRARVWVRARVRECAGCYQRGAYRGFLVFRVVRVEDQAVQKPGHTHVRRCVSKKSTKNTTWKRKNMICWGEVCAYMGFVCQRECVCVRVGACVCARARARVCVCPRVCIMVEVVVMGV